MKRFVIIFSAALVLLALGGWLARDWLAAQMYLRTMEVPNRVDALQVDRVIQALNLRPGQRVADIGAGTGLFSRPFARAVHPGGVVYAVDVNERLLEHIAETAERDQLTNLRVVLAAPDDPLLPETVDLIFFCDVLHHISNRGAYLETLQRYLQPEGRLAIIDLKPSSQHLLPSMKFDEQEFAEWIRAAGYELEAEFDFVKGNFFRVFRRAGS